MIRVTYLRLTYHIFARVLMPYLRILHISWHVTHPHTLAQYKIFRTPYFHLSCQTYLIFAHSDALFAYAAYLMAQWRYICAHPTHNDVTYVHTLHTMRHSSDTFCTYLRLTCPTFAHSDAVYAYAAYLMSRPIDVTSHWCHVPLMSRPISPRPTRWCVISWIAQMNVSITSILGFRV